MAINIELYRDSQGRNNGANPLGTAPDVPTIPLESAQLSAGNYVDRVIDPELIFPRPDSETAAWAKHRRHHPNVPYRIPIGISFGSWPFYFEAISVPSGATVGSFLTPSGDSLIVGDDYGVVEWTNPTVGNHSFHIRVHFQDGYASLDVQWTLEVTTAGTIFVDPVNGNDSTGDGTINNPFQTNQGWYEDDHTLDTYTGYQVCYRAGTHVLTAPNVAQGITAGSIRCNSQNKPLVHYAYHGESVTADFSNASFTIGYPNTEPVGQDGSDWFWSVNTSGIRDVDNPACFSIFGSADGDRTYTAGQGGQRMTFFECEHKDALNNNTATNNAGIVFAPNAGTDDKRHYLYASRVTFNNVRQVFGGRSGNYNGYYVSSTFNWLSEHITEVGCNFGGAAVSSKDSVTRMCIRNLNSAASSESLFRMLTTGSYDPEHGGQCEVSYSRITFDEDIAGSAVRINPNYDTYEPITKSHLPVYLVRNTIFASNSHGSSAAINIAGSWATYMYGNHIATDTNVFIGTENTNAADTDDYIVGGLASVDADLNLVDRATHLGSFGVEVINEHN